jgi:hypothetical protein
MIISREMEANHLLDPIMSVRFCETPCFCRVGIALLGGLLLSASVRADIELSGVLADVGNSRFVLSETSSGTNSSLLKVGDKPTNSRLTVQRR